MLLSPIQNQAKYGLGGWKQVRPHLSQKFGENPGIYEQFGMKGHNGVDYSGSKNSHDIFSPMRGKARVKKDTGGYGLHVKIRDHSKEVVLGHFKSLNITDGQEVFVGDKIGIMGNTGFSTGTHLHFGLRYIEKGQGDIFSWPVKDYDNGYKGYIDPVPYLITWKGTQETNTL